MNSTDYDLIVVGAGAAGTAAALSAAETAKEIGKECRIVILERTEESEWGGNSRFTTSNFRMVDEDHLYPTFEEDMLKDSKGRINKEYLHRLTLEAPDTIKWICSRGVVLERRPGNWSVAGFKMGPVGGGYEIISHLRESAEKLGVSMIFGATAYKLALDENGKVSGLFIRHRNGSSKKLNSKAIILAGGGFEGNYEMLTKYLGREALALKMDTPATKFHMGECMNMAFEIGAAPSGDFGNYHGDLVDARSTSYRSSIRAYVHGILVNQDAERFVDEGMDEISGSFEYMSRGIFKQPGHKAFVIFDSKARSLPEIGKDIKTNIPPIEGSVLEELAVKLSIEPSKLVRTVNEFNSAIQPGTFDPTKLDGKHTNGVGIEKSNWARAIDTPPFYCFPVVGTVQFTWGGVATDSKGRVCSVDGSPIEGLYAAGETVGTYYYHFTPGTAVITALTYGRISGFEALMWMNER